MPVTCDRHPTRPAWWRCPKCHKSLCPQCVSKRYGGQFQDRTYYFCSKCNVEVKSYELSQVIPPFWTRLHKFFLYPLSSIQSAGLILTLSLLSTFFSKPGLFSIMFQLALWAVMVKYSFECLKSSAEGRFKPPELTDGVLVENYSIVFKQVLLFIALFLFFLFVVTKGGLLFMGLFVLFCAIGLPAMLIILIINEDVLQAMNPIMVIGVISRIGGMYFLLLFFLLLLSGAPAALGYAVIQYLPEGMQTFMVIFSKNYYTVIIYHMMGYVILQYHHRLDYAIDLETILASMYPMKASENQDSEGPSDSTGQDDLLNDIGLLIQDGELDKAIEEIERRVNTAEIEDRELSTRYFGLLKAQKVQQKLLAFAPNHLKLLVKSDAKSDAVEAYLECLRIDKAFTLDSVVQFKIASWLTERGKHKEAILTLNALIKKNPKDALVPKAYYRAAQIFRERLDDVEKAKKILQTMIAKYPDLEITAFAKNYLGSIQK
jgi:tetratricopeptide (TPR) repeat protein